MKRLRVVLVVEVSVADSYAPAIIVAQKFKLLPANLFVPNKIEHLELTYQFPGEEPVKQ